MSEHKWIIGLILLIVLVGIVALRFAWPKPTTTDKPRAIVTTFNGDAHTTRAFTWYTYESDSDTVLQLIKGSDTSTFNHENQVTSFRGITTKLNTKNAKQGVHKIEATGLAPGTLYTYRIGNGEENGWSEPASFTTEPAEQGAFSFINVTDSQGETKADFARWGQTLNKAFQTFPEARFIVHNGDLTEDPKDEAAWGNLFAQAQKWVTQIPLMPITGNHDEVDGDAKRFVSHFNLPNNGAAGSIVGTNYSFDYGTVHISVLNSESNIDEQEMWLRQDLARSDKPWKLVALHRGPYGGNIYKKVQGWVNVFDEYGVDLVLQGHNHEYSRSYPLRNNQVVANVGEDVEGTDHYRTNGEETDSVGVNSEGTDSVGTTVDGTKQNKSGTIYVVTNAAGNKLNEKKEDLFYHKVHFQKGKPMFAGISIDGDTLTYQAYDVDGQKLDQFVIKH
ncbi:MAG: metallophosphoesterase family protein [Gorillibacterium sp.]|nr:metallophosphoesterase family protein [Gorillibacterium sp.]